MGSRSLWRCTPAVTVHTAADVTAIFYLVIHFLPDLQQERTYTASAGEKAPAFTSEDGALPQYTLLYGPPDKQVSAHQKKGIWRAIAKEVRTLRVFDRRSTHCCKRWEDLRRWARKTAETHLGLASQRGRGARHTLTPTDVLHPGSGLSGVGWALESITAATGGGTRQPSQCATNTCQGQEGSATWQGQEGATSSKEKEAQPASKAKSKTPAARSIEAPSSAKGRKEHRTPARALQPSEASGEGLEATTTTASTATCTATSSTTASSSSPSGQPSEAAVEGLEPSPTPVSTATCTAASTAICTTASTATCTATSSTTASNTTASSSSPSGQLSKAAGERLEPLPITCSTDTSTATTVQPSPPADGL
ncbi:hypothetical protein NDU88_003384 [Pleurodeles waltl]|uniref:Myb-like domain-containing protein n=1 Tax=Pleurodeles waltl TaxID=8319 RepID=A0AAV7VD75_PLEWA|nr:hypothetical protein NDU88_003384 [Pleurodeles waltl]